MEAIVFMALLPLPPETFELFDDIVFNYHLARELLIFLQEADPSRPYTFVCASEFAEAFKNSKFGKNLKLELNYSYDKSQTHLLALAKTKFAASKWKLFRACFPRE
uniref:Uncharacterized protein n=1 Tax=Cucumis melo TaxID=3656 RepID=A0A9I9EEU8_CUCME